MRGIYSGVSERPQIFFDSATVLSIQRFLIGARTNLAHRPAAIESVAVAMNTAFHEPMAGSTEASATSIEALPLAVYSVPAFAEAYLPPMRTTLRLRDNANSASP